MQVIADVRVFVEGDAVFFADTVNIVINDSNGLWETHNALFRSQNYVNWKFRFDRATGFGVAVFKK